MALRLLIVLIRKRGKSFEPLDHPYQESLPLVLYPAIKEALWP